MRNKTDAELGSKIQKLLQERHLETVRKVPQPKFAREYLAKGLSDFFGFMGLDLNDPSIEESPTRIADMFTEELCAGLDYANFPKCTSQPNINSLDEMVVLKDISTISLCEHHFQTIAGRTHIAYIPKGKLIGVSKLARVTNFFMRRPQVQERMTAQIFYALKHILGTQDVAVLQDCVHFCIRARGVMDPNSSMITSKLGGRFMENPSLRQEFLHAIR